MALLAVWQSDRANHEPEECCRKVWDVLRPLYVTDARNADRISWVRCHLPNERASFRYFMEHTVPSIRALDLGPEPCARVTGPVLIIHGTLDRSAPYGGGRDWATRLPDARLVTVVDAGHAPWVEQQSLVLNVLKTFLSGEWPQEAERVGESRSA